MFEIDKKQFGEFIADMRRQKLMTQKELAGKLFVSDKAVSKWECGLSMPDITLLKPLSEILGVTVTELLECRRIDAAEHIDVEKMELIVNKAVHFSEEEVQEQRRRKKKCGIAFVICALLGTLIWISLPAMGLSWGMLLLPLLLSLMMGFVFGIWFCFLAKEKLPSMMKTKSLIIVTGFLVSIWWESDSITAIGSISCGWDVSGLWQVWCSDH